MATSTAQIPLAQQMDADEPNVEARHLDSFDPVCNFYAYNGNECQCFYDVCCSCCVYGDIRVMDELIKGLPGTLDLPEARTLRLGQHTNTPVCCLPGCTRHCLFLASGMLPFVIGQTFGWFSVTHNLPLYCLFNKCGAIYMTVIGGRNRQKLKDRYKITQPTCSLFGCSIERSEPYCCWLWNPLVWGQEARYLRQKFKALSISGEQELNTD